MNRSKHKVKYIVENKWLLILLSLFIVGGFIFGVKTMDLVKSGKDLDGPRNLPQYSSAAVPAMPRLPPPGICPG